MRSGKRKIIYAAVVAMLVLSLGLLGICAAIPLQVQYLNVATSDTADLPPDAELEAPIALFHQSTGFALDRTSGEFHLLRVHIVQVRSVQPAEMRELLESEKTAAEIKEELMAQESEQLYKGYLRLDNHNYRLENISVNASEMDGERTISASVMYPTLDPETVETLTMAGGLIVTTKDYDGGRIGEGSLTMDDESYHGTYRTLLLVLPPPSVPQNGQ
ncbi:MAG: hypothetical protein JW945_07535 [Methanomicrobia archaeon]|nr:hypothetical protein [Methanomicrobia archaeon]